MPVFTAYCPASAPAGEQAMNWQQAPLQGASNSINGEAVARVADPVFASLTGIVADWSASTHVTAFSTTRLGGVSQPPFDALNLGVHVGDDAAAVQENRRRLEASFVLPGSPHWLKQTHGIDVVSVAAAPAGGNSVIKVDEAGKHRGNTANSRDQGAVQPPGPIEADGAYTDQADTVIAVLTADCLPVVISNDDGSAVAVVHAGWRGLAAGILENALAKFSTGESLHAWLGPAIGAKAFEVGEDVVQAFTQRQPASEAAFKPAASVGKYRADLYSLARAELQQSASVLVTGGEYCTFTQADLFHSHRRDGVASGRMATVAWVDRRV